jgi:hypothetical protein
VSTKPSRYLISVTTVDGGPVYLRPGGSAERDLGTLLATKLAAKGVGIFRSTAHVLADLDEALGEAVMELKSDVQPTV